MKLGSKINGQATTASGSKIAFAFRALNSRNYRLFFSGQLVSLIGTWMAITTTTWLVFSLTHNAWLMGLSAFIGQVPTFILGPFTGVVVDRIDKKKLLLATQTGAMLQTFILAFLTLTHQVTYMDIVVLNALSGIVNAFDMPTRQSLMVRLVDRKEDLSGAIAMNSSMVNVGRLIGPTIGGLVIASFGEGICYVANGVSFLAVIGSILMIRLASDPSQKRNSKNSHFQNMLAGWRYAFSSLPIRSVLLLLATVSLVSVPYTTFMPIMAKDVLHGDPKTLGIMMGAIGVGALIGALRLAARPSPRGLISYIPRSSLVFGAGLILFSFSHWLYFSLAMLTVTGYGFISQLASCNTFIQTIVDDDKRGRVMGLYAMAFSGTVPFGNLLAGKVAQLIGAPHTITLCGIGCVIGALYFITLLPRLKKDIAPIYERLGIIAVETPDLSVEEETAR